MSDTPTLCKCGHPEEKHTEALGADDPEQCWGSGSEECDCWHFTPAPAVPVEATTRCRCGHELKYHADDEVMDCCVVNCGCSRFVPATPSAPAAGETPTVELDIPATAEERAIRRAPAPERIADFVLCLRERYVSASGDGPWFARLATYLEEVAPALRANAELRSRLSLLEQQTAAMRAENELLMVANKEQWAIAPQCNGGWVVCETNDVGISGDADEGRELSRTRGTLTEALTLARASLARDTNQETTE